VCRQYLTDYCTHELFTNTRSDLGERGSARRAAGSRARLTRVRLAGPCPKAHDEQAKREFAAACERDAALKGATLAAAACAAAR
jgi:hypothetical protein